MDQDGASPTHVGMNPRNPGYRGVLWCKPHACGERTISPSGRLDLLMMLRTASAYKADTAGLHREAQQVGGYSRWLEKARQERTGRRHGWSPFEHEQYAFNQDSSTPSLMKLIKQAVTAVSYSAGSALG